MGWLADLARAVTSERRAVNANVFFDRLADGGGSFTGRSVSVESALSGTVAVYAAVALLSETVGSLPVQMFRRVSDRQRDRIAATPERWPGSLARMLRDGPNPEMTGQEYWETVEGHVDLWGNHFSLIRRAGDGRPRELWPLRPDMMEVGRVGDDSRLPTGPRFYVYTLPNGEKRGLNRAEVLHVMDFNTDGVKGRSRIEVARNAIAIEQAASEHEGRFFQNSAMPSGLLMADKPLTEEQAKDLKEQWQNLHGGISRSQGVAVLHSGVTWQAVGMPMKDAQFVELRRFQIEEVARLFRIPLHLLGDTTKETTWGTGVEQMTLGWVVYTLRSKLNRIESAINRDLGDPQAARSLLDESLFAEFKVEGLLRGDMETRAAFYASGIQNGWLTREDVRALENLSLIEGLDRPLVPLNMTVVGPDGQPSPPPEDINGSRSRYVAAYEKHLKEYQHA